MNERKFAELLKYNVDSLENYFEDVIKKSSLEYSLHRCGIYKTVDMYVECEKSIILIECKKQLKAHDIGQVLTYKVMYGDCIDKEVKLCLAYMNCSKDELKLIRDYIDMYNLNVALIEYNSYTNELSFVNFNKTNKTEIINKTPNVNYNDRLNMCSYLLFDFNILDIYYLLISRFAGLHSVLVTSIVYYTLRLTILKDVPENLDKIIIIQIIILGLIFQIKNKKLYKYFTRRLKK